MAPTAAATATAAETADRVDTTALLLRALPSTKRRLLRALRPARRLPPPLLAALAVLTVVAEGGVAFPQRAGQVLLRAAREVHALGGMPGGAVEQGSDQLGHAQAHLLVGLVDEQLHHVQLVGRQPGNPARQAECRPLELIARR